MSGRVYVRRFDHDEARARHAAGESAAALAREYGVTGQAVRRVVVPGLAERMERNNAAWGARGRCDDCGGPMSNHSRSLGSTRCKSCSHLHSATTVRPTELRCVSCREWKTDNGFYLNATENGARRGRHSQCRACNTIARRDYRRRNREKDNTYQRERRRRANQPTTGAP